MILMLLETVGHPAFFIAPLCIKLAQCSYRELDPFRHINEVLISIIIIIIRVRQLRL